MKATVLNISHNGHFLKDENTKLEWGVKLQQENIEDKIKEWTLIDSAGFTLPHPNDNIGGISDSNQEVLMTDFLKTELKLTTFRNSGYFQFNKEIGNFTVNAGTEVLLDF